MAPDWDRLKDRKLVQWAIGYLAAAWVLLQVLGQIAGMFEWPGGVLKAVFVLLVVGFFAVLIVAYYHGERGEQGVRAPELVMLAVLALIAVPLVYFVSRARNAAAVSTARAVVTSKSIAVLPFETITRDDQSMAFAAGAQDAILTLLAKVGDLKVTSGTSTQQYTTANRDIPLIARALGVGAILEGSVQRAGNKIRVQAQLIDGATDTHLWANEYTGDITDLFAIQSEIANSIATELKTQLTANEKISISTAPTQNAPAYDAYMNARQYQIRPGRLKEDLDAAAQLYRRAIALDPGFALAYARLSQIEGSYHWFNRDQNAAAHRIAQRAAADKALELAPGLPEAHMAKAIALYWIDFNYAEALRELEIARKGLPNDADIVLWRGQIYRRQGRWKEAEQAFSEAIKTDPRNSQYWVELCLTQYSMHHPGDAVSSCKRGLEIYPTNWGAAAWLWRAQLRLTGTLDGLKRVMADSLLARTSDSSRALHEFLLRYFMRDVDGGLALVARNRAGFTGRIIFVPRQLAAARLYDLRGDAQRARVNYDSARVVADSAVRADPVNVPYRIALAYAYAGLGLKTEAARETRTALSLFPVEKDAINGADYLQDAAMIYARNGMTDEAIRILQRIVGQPAGPAAVDLRIDPRWDPVRADLRFQELLKK